MNHPDRPLERTIRLKEHLRNAAEFLRQHGIPIALGTESSLAGAPGDSLAAWLSTSFNHNFDAYDRAIDAAYIASRTGGPLYHHLIDGSHDLLSAFTSAGSVATDDSWLTELSQASEHLLRDGMSVSGINPFLGLTPTQFDELSRAASHLGVTKLYLADALTLNGPELLGGGIALAGAVLLGRSADPARLTQFGSGCLVSALASANPLLLPIAAGAMLYGFHRSPGKPAAAVSAGKGALVSGAALLTANLVGGPIWLGCIAATAAAVAISYSLEHPITTLRKITELTQSARNALRSTSKTLAQETARA